MVEQLSEMTLEELWRVFPIILTEHQGCWKERYLEEEINELYFRDYLNDFPDVAKEYEKLK